MNIKNILIDLTEHYGVLEAIPTQAYLIQKGFEADRPKALVL